MILTSIKKKLVDITERGPNCTKRMSFAARRIRGEMEKAKVWRDPVLVERWKEGTISLVCASFERGEGEYEPEP